VVGGGGTGVEMVGWEAALERGVGDEEVDEWRVGRVFGASSVGGSAKTEKGEEKGGGGSGPAAAGAGGTSLFGQRRAGADGWAPVVVRAERRARHAGMRGPAREEKRGGRAQMNSMILDLFKLIQTSSN
jgi:hypothetical protein